VETGEVGLSAGVTGVTYRVTIASRSAMASVVDAKGEQGPATSRASDGE
jgi:hypothetical protein